MITLHGRPWTIFARPVPKIFLSSEAIFKDLVSVKVVRLFKTDSLRTSTRKIERSNSTYGPDPGRPQSCYIPFEIY